MNNKYIDIAVGKAEVPGRLEDNVEQYLKITEKNLNTYIAKNIDYGDSFQVLFDKFGLKSSIIRLHDKLLRLEQLEDNDAEVNESIDDTLEDMINYAIMTLIARRHQNDNSVSLEKHKEKQCNTCMAIFEDKYQPKFIQTKYGLKCAYCGNPIK